MKRLFGTVLVGLLACSSGVVRAADMAVSAPPPADIEQALANLSSEDSAAQEAAANVLMATGDAGLLAKLEDMRANADRSVRMVIKPIADLLKNKAKLRSIEADDRRSAATDLGSLGKPVAVPWMEGALQQESDRWVRYTLEESINLIKLSTADPVVQAAAATKLGELHSQNAVPMLKELASGASEPVSFAAREAIERIETWGSWANGFETIFRGISLSSILL